MKNIFHIRFVSRKRKEDIMKNSYKVPAYILAGFIAFGTTQASAGFSDATFSWPIEYKEAQAKNLSDQSKRAYGITIVKPSKAKKEDKK